jgi:hypothetical protein
MLILTFSAEQIAPVRYSCAPAGDGFLKNLFRRSPNLLPLPQGDSAYRPPGIDGYFMENLAGIYVPDTGNPSLIQQE